MPTRHLMTAAAFVLGIVGLAATIAPRELLAAAGGGAGDRVAAVAVQLLGAAALGFAMLDWMSRGSMLGGIYGRPLVVGNLLHFFAGAMALTKAATAAGSGPLLAPAAVYGLLAALFALLLFRNPPELGARSANTSS